MHVIRCITITSALLILHQNIIQANPSSLKLVPVPIETKQNIGSIFQIKVDQNNHWWLNTNKGIHIYDGKNLSSYVNFRFNQPYHVDNAPYEYWHISKFDSNQVLISSLQQTKQYIVHPRHLTIIDSSKGKTANVLRFHHFGNRYYFIQRNVENRKLQFTVSDNLNQESSGIYSFDWNGEKRVYYEILKDHHVIQIGEQLYIFDAKLHVRVFDMQCAAITANNRDFFALSNTHKTVLQYNFNKNKFEPRFQIQNDHFIGETFIQQFGDSLVIRMANTIVLYNLKTNKQETAAIPSHFFPLNCFIGKEDRIYFYDASHVFELKKNQTQQSQKKPVVLFPDKSFRQITTDHHGNIYASYYCGIVRGRGLQFQPFLEYDKNRIESTLGTFGLLYHAPSLIWNNAEVNPVTRAIRFLKWPYFVGHTTLVETNNEIYLYRWRTNFIYVIDSNLQLKDSIPLPSQFLSNLGTFGEINQILVFKDELLLATKKLGILRIDKTGRLKKTYSLTKLYNKTSGDIFCMYCKENKLYCGTSSGLGYIDLNTDKMAFADIPFYPKIDLRTHKAVFQINPLNDSLAVVSTDYGLYILQTKLDVLYPWRLGNKVDSMEYNRNGSYYIDSTLYLSAINGLVIIPSPYSSFPDHVNKVWHAAIQYIRWTDKLTREHTYVNANQKALNEIVLSKNDINIQISVLLNSFNENYQLYYKLEGLSEDWKEIEEGNILTLSNLPAGDYTLKLKVNTDIILFQSPETSLKIIVQEIWYKRVWAVILGTILGCLLIGFGLYQLINLKRKKENRERDFRINLSSDLHDAVGTVLSNLQIKSILLSKSSTPVSKEELEEIKQLSHTAMESLRDTVWFIDRRKDSSSDLETKLIEFAHSLFQKTQVNYVISNTIKKDKLHPEIRQALYLIAKEALVNCAKHSNAKEIKIALDFSASHYDLHIEDNGKQYNPTNRIGFGLANMQRRAEKLDGKLDIEHSQHGFSIRVRIPEK